MEVIGTPFSNIIRRTLIATINFGLLVISFETQYYSSVPDIVDIFITLTVTINGIAVFVIYQQRLAGYK